MTKKSITEGQDPAIAYAEKQYEKAHSTLLGHQESILEIIKGRLWEPLGYESFGKSLIDRMSDIRIRVEFAPHVIYELLDEEMPLDEIKEILKGVGPEMVENLAAEHEAGVPPEQASGRSRTHRESLTVFVHPGRERLVEWRVMEAELDRSLEEIIIDVLDDFFVVVREEEKAK